MKGEAQAIALLEARLTSDSEKDVRLAAAIAIGQVSVTGDVQTIALLGARPTSDSKETSICRSTAIGQVYVKGEAQTIALRGPGSPATAGKMSVWPQ